LRKLEGSAVSGGISVGDVVKVLIVTPSYFPIVGGSETLIRTLSTKLNEAGVHTDVMAFNMDEKWKVLWSEEIYKNSNFKIFKVPGFKPLPFLSESLLYQPLRINVLPRLDFKKRFEDYDIIHFLGEADLSLPFFSRPVKKPKIMHCVSVPTLDSQLRKHTVLSKPLVRIFRNLANLYIVFSPEEKKVLVDMGIPTNNVLLLHYGVDTEVFRPDESKKLDNLILFVGRIDRVKGLHVLLRSLRYLDFKTKVVVIGPTGDSRYFAQIEKMSSEVNRQGVHSVDYLGEMEQNDLVPWYQKATVLARPDLIGSSGAGCSTLEALACGTPVVGVGNHVVKNDVNGLIIPRNDSERLGDALRRVLLDRSLRERYGREARRVIEEHFSVKSCITKLIRIYDFLLNSQFA
jgi:glycosyltransferase involved in cell wall biosynthesis